MEEKYIFLILGVILGAAIMLYFFCYREEKIERTIIRNQKVFSTKKLDLTMQNVVERIDYKIKEVKRELTEDEKNEIIIQSYKEKFII